MDGETGIDSPFGEIISSYTRADALRDGVLIALPRSLCEEAGIISPVAVTERVWHILDPGNLHQMPGQSLTGRMWDLIWMFAFAARSAAGRHHSSAMFRCEFLFCRETLGGAEITERKTVTFRAVCGPGDRGEPVITIMLPDKD